jgi:hypothetical protein
MSEAVGAVKPKQFFPQNTHEPSESQHSAGNPATVRILYIVQTSNKHAQEKTYRERIAAQVLHKVLLSMPSGLAIFNPLHSFL